MALIAQSLSLRPAQGTSNAPSRKATTGFKFLKKLGVKKPSFLPDFGKPEGLGSSKVAVEKPVPGVSADALWAVVSDWSGPYIDGIAKVTSTSGTGVGATRALTTEDYAEFTQELILFDNEKKKLGYKIVDPAPFPVEKYGAKIVVDSEDEGCSITYTVWYDPKSENPEQLADKFSGAIDGFVSNAIALASK